MGILNSRSGNKNVTVRPSERTALTPYDPIRNLPGYNATRFHRASGKLAQRISDRFRARTGRPRRVEGDTGIALPRRDYSDNQ